MIRTIVGTLAVTLALSTGLLAQAQIKVIKKPAPEAGPGEVVVYKWWSSWGLRDDPPNQYPLGISTHKTEADAVAAAKTHIAGTSANGSLAVTHYLIEGEPELRNAMVVRGEQAKDMLGKVKEAKKAVDDAQKVAKGDAPLLKATERKLGDTIKEYKAMVEQSYRQASEVKRTVTGGVATLTDAQFREVNGLIDQYNREVDDFRSAMGGDFDLGFSPLPRMRQQPETTSDPEAKEYWVSHRALFPHSGKPPTNWNDEFVGPYTLNEAREIQESRGGSSWNKKDSSGKVVDEFRIVRSVNGKIEVIK